MSEAERDAAESGALRIAVAVLVTTSAIYFFCAPVADPDLWGHVRFGQVMLERGSLPTANEFSYSEPSHPWINHEILAEIIFAGTFERFGAAGLVGLKIVLGLLTIAIMSRTVAGRAQSTLARGGALVLAASLMSFGYLFRPQLFTFLGMAILWQVLQSHAAGKRAPIIALPVLFLVWTNTHGGVMAGIATLGLFTLLEPRTSHRSFAIVSVGLASLLVLFANPYGPGLPIFLIEDLARSRPISEWAPIPLFDFSNAHFKAAVLIVVGGLVASRPRRLWEAAILAFWIVAAVRHQRHLPLFAIVATPALAEAFDRALSALQQRVRVFPLSRGASFALAAGLLAVAGLQSARPLGLIREVGFGIYVPPGELPVDAVHFIRQNGLRGNLALPFDWGEYAIWHLFPDCRVAIDGRFTTAYSDETIASAWRYMEGTEGWDVLLERADLALTDRRHPTASLLFRRPGWRYVYSDPTAFLFVRDDLPLPPTLDRSMRTSGPIFP